MLYLWFILFIQMVAGEWLDPHDMNFKPKTKLNQLKNGPEPKLNPEGCNCSKHVDNVHITYLKRIVSLLISSTTVDSHNPDVLIGKYVFFNQKDEIKFLHQFLATEEIDTQKLRELDNILNEAFRKNVLDNVFENLLTIYDRLIELFNTNTMFYIGIAIALYIFYYLLNTNFGYWYTLKYFIFIILIIDYGFKYQAMKEVSK